jgi:hypothetical protein
LPWLDDLITSRPKITEGRAYWAISPATRQPAQTAGGIPIGIDNDAAYFGKNLAYSIGQTLAVPPSVAAIREISDWQFATLCHLVGCRSLSFVSIWSPTFLLLLIDAISKNLDGIVNQLDEERAAEIRDIFAAERIEWRRLWPMLDTISCWCSSTSRRYAEEIADRFPETHIQGKGLLATEGIVSIPLTDAGGSVLAVDSEFYEFEAEDGKILTAWELETGATYNVILTTSAGLYRYRLGDRVRVSGWYEATPCLEFVGREGLASDLCGEKLTDEFIATALGDIPGFGFLVPISSPRPSYLLVLDAAIVSDGQEEDAAGMADEKLMQNPQYRYARELGQLPGLNVCRVANPLGTYKRVCVETGQRLGDIKPSVLASIKWGEQFNRATVP